MLFSCSRTRVAWGMCSQSNVMLQRYSEAIRNSVACLNPRQIIKVLFLLFSTGCKETFSISVATGLFSISLPVKCLSPTFCSITEWFRLVLCSFSLQVNPVNVPYGIWPAFTPGNSQCLLNMISKISFEGWMLIWINIFKMERTEADFHPKRGGRLISRVKV